MSNFKTLSTKRKSLRKRITQLYDGRAWFSNLSPLEIKENLELVHSYKEELIALDDSMHEMIIDVDDGEDVPEISEDQLDRCREYRDKLSKVVTALEACGPPDVSNIQPRVDANRSLEPRSVLRSPVAPLPRFTSAEGEDLTRFFIELKILLVNIVILNTTSFYC